MLPWSSAAGYIVVLESSVTDDMSFTGFFSVTLWSIPAHWTKPPMYLFGTVTYVVRVVLVVGLFD